ncbi:putative ribonuclease H-like domain-containing protein [Tanacetum coccineum]
MRTKPGVDTLSFDDLYNNLKVFKSDVKGSTVSSSSIQNVAFVSSESISSINDVVCLWVFLLPSGYNHKGKIVIIPTAEIMYSFFANQSSGPQLDHEDLELKKFYNKIGRKLQFDAKEPVGFNKTKVKCFNYHKTGHFARECRLKGNQDIRRRDAWNTGYKAKDNGRRPGKQEEPKALVTLDGDGVDWTGHAENESSDVEDSPVYDRFAKVEGMHAVPPLMTGNYMPPKSDYAETLESVSEPVVVEPKVVSQPKDWSDAPIIEYHLIRDCDCHEKRIAKQVELNKKKGKGTGQGENRLVWNNEQRLNHQNKFVPIAVLTRTGRIPVNTARQNLSSQAATTSTARKVNTARPIVNEIRQRNNFYKFHSPIRRPFNRTAAPKSKFSNQKVNTAEIKAVRAVKGKRETIVKPSASCNWRPKRNYWNKFSKYNGGKYDNPQRALKNKGIIDSGCSRHMTGNKAYLVEYQDYNGGPVAFGGSKGYITGKGKIKTGNLDFEDVCFVKELQHFNLFSVSQMCDKKNKVLFTDTECLVLSSDFKLPDENQVLLRIPRQNNMYSFNLENIVPSGGLACLIAKATVDESNKWHRRLGHVNFKNLNKLVKGNLVRGLPSKIFQNDHTCVACQKGKQHKASCKAKSVSSISQPLQLLHMDLFGPTSVRSINHKTYCLVITDDFSRFSWVFFLRTKDETSGILKDFIRQIENQLNQKVKTIRCDNGTEFKNRDIIEFCGSKGIKREYSNVELLRERT